MFKFPYTNLHELNLDWILSKVKKFAELITPMEQAVDEISELEDDVAQAVEDASQAVEDASDAKEIAEEAKEIAEQASQGVIADGAVITQKLADGAVTYPKLDSSLQQTVDDVGILNHHKLYPTGDQTDRWQEIQDKLNTYGCCELVEGDFYISDTIILPNRSTLKGCGKNVRLFRRPLSGVYTMLATTGTSGNVTVKDLYIVGENSAKPVSDVSSGEIGLLVSGTGGKVTVENCNFYGIKNIGIQVTMGLSELTSVNVVNCVFQFCGKGIQCSTSGEYANISNSNFLSCRIGAVVIGGNNKFANCGFEDNNIGFSLWDDAYTPSNDGHGSAVGCSFNHNDTMAITIEEINYGYTFSGCNIFDGDVYIKHSKGIIFDGCLLMGVKTGTSLHSNFSLNGNSDGLIAITNCCAVFDAFTITKTGSNPFVFVQNNKTSEGLVVAPENRYRQMGYAQLATDVIPNSYGDLNVTFPVAFPSGVVPFVFFSPQLDSTTNESGKIQFFINSVSNTGFTVRMFNNATINRKFNIYWVAEIRQ